MENSMEAFVMALGIFMFCAGISLFMMGNAELSALIDEQIKLAYENNVVY